MNIGFYPPTSFSCSPPRFGNRKPSKERIALDRWLMAPERTKQLHEAPQNLAGLTRAYFGEVQDKKRRNNAYHLMRKACIAAGITIRAHADAVKDPERIRRNGLAHRKQERTDATQYITLNRADLLTEQARLGGVYSSPHIRKMRGFSPSEIIPKKLSHAFAEELIKQGYVLLDGRGEQVTKSRRNRKNSTEERQYINLYVSTHKKHLLTLQAKGPLIPLEVARGIYGISAQQMLDERFLEKVRRSLIASGYECETKKDVGLRNRDLFLERINPFWDAVKRGEVSNPRRPKDKIHRIKRPKKVSIREFYQPNGGGHGGGIQDSNATTPAQIVEAKEAQAKRSAAVQTLLIDLEKNHPTAAIALKSQFGFPLTPSEIKTLNAMRRARDEKSGEGVLKLALEEAMLVARERLEYAMVG